MVVYDDCLFETIGFIGHDVPAVGNDDDLVVKITEIFWLEDVFSGFLNGFRGSSCLILSLIDF